MTPVERELLTECETIARDQSRPVAEILVAAVRFWETAGRSIEPRRWKARAAAARRLLGRLDS